MKKTEKPKKWFPESSAVIKFRGPRIYDDHPGMLSPRFDSWTEAHQFMLERGAREIAEAKKNLANAERRLKKVRAMKEPQS